MAADRARAVSRRASLGDPAAELAAAARFLTRIPIPDRPAATALSGDARTGAAAFGAIGLVLGVVAAAPIALAGASHPVPAALLGLGLLTVLSGALHLDGLADTADALAAPAGAAERARTDPRSGGAGVVSLVLVLGLDAALLAELATRGPLTAAAAVVLAAVASRASAPVWAILVGRRFPGTIGGGLGRWFADRTSPAAAVIAVGSVVTVGAALAAIAGLWIVGAALIGTLLTAAAGGAVVAARRQLDGDGYGALVEIAFCSVLVAAALVR